VDGLAPCFTSSSSSLRRDGGVSPALPPCSSSRRAFGRALRYTGGDRRRSRWSGRSTYGGSSPRRLPRSGHRPNSGLVRSAGVATA
jgi:hypothetical protein